jgi:hypothetical protein
MDPKLCLSSFVRNGYDVEWSAAINIFLFFCSGVLWGFVVAFMLFNVDGNH